MKIPLIKTTLKNMKPADAERIITWTAPMTFVPLMRTFQDKDKENKLRKELFFRDLLAYSLSCLAFFAGRFTAGQALKIKPIAQKKLTDGAKSVIKTSAGMAFYVLWSGIGALKFSKIIAKDKNINVKSKNIDAEVFSGFIKK